MTKTQKIYGILGGVGVIGLVLAMMTFFIVPEGHLYVITNLGEAVRIEKPGFHGKNPFTESTVEMEVRSRKSVEKMAAATANQLPVTATVSFNWTVNKAAALKLYVQYGSLEQFENRVLDPRIRSATKAAISRFPADQLISKRLAVVAKIQANVLEKVEGLPVTISTTQLENIVLPATYMESILAKEQAREQAEMEKHNLVKQKLEAQQKVQTAEAKRDADKARADGTAYATLITAKAEAEAIRLVTAQLGQSPQYIELVRAKAWDGILPKTILGSSTSALLQLPVLK